MQKQIWKWLLNFLSPSRLTPVSFNCAIRAHYVACCRKQLFDNILYKNRLPFVFIMNFGFVKGHFIPRIIVVASPVFKFEMFPLVAVCSYVKVGRHQLCITDHVLTRLIVFYILEQSGTVDFMLYIFTNKLLGFLLYVSSVRFIIKLSLKRLLLWIVSKSWIYHLRFRIHSMYMFISQYRTLKNPTVIVLTIYKLHVFICELFQIFIVLHD